MDKKINTLPLKESVEIPADEQAFYEHLAETLEDLHIIQFAEKLVHDNRSNVGGMFDIENIEENDVNFYTNNKEKILRHMKKTQTQNKFSPEFVKDDAIEKPMTVYGLAMLNKAALMIDTAIIHELGEREPLKKVQKFLVKLMTFNGISHKNKRNEKPIKGLFKTALNYVKHGATNTLTRMKNSHTEDVSSIIKAFIRVFSKPYMVGRTPEEALSHPEVQKIHQKGGEITLAPEYENAKTVEEAYKNYKIFENFLLKMIQNNKENNIHDTMAIKLSAFGKAESKDQIANHFNKFYDLAKKEGGVFFVDMEDQPYKEFTFDLVTSKYEEDEKATSHIGYVLQCYRKDSVEDAKKLVKLANKLERPIKVRIVKGAYEGRDKEYVADGIITTQDQYIKIDYLFQNCPNIEVIEASHNSNSLGYAIAGEYMSKEKNEKPHSIEMLFGLGDPARKATEKMLKKLQKVSSRAENISISPYCPAADEVGGAEYSARRYKEVEPGKKSMPHVFINKINAYAVGTKNHIDNYINIKATEVRKDILRVIKSGNLNEAITAFDDLKNIA